MVARLTRPQRWPYRKVVSTIDLKLDHEALSTNGVVTRSKVLESL